mmetsp:Transcript_39186/g.116110  ORF Transcript_39186/g.116110 Transcript_39186/m.116110 type:complete len:92 (-) Transcript_39186:22-297(-)
MNSPIIMNMVQRYGWSKAALAAPGPVSTFCMVMNFMSKVFSAPLISMTTMKKGRPPIPVVAPPPCACDDMALRVQRYDMEVEVKPRECAAF